MEKPIRAVRIRTAQGRKTDGAGTRCTSQRHDGL